MTGLDRISVIIPAMCVTRSLMNLIRDLGQRGIFEILVISPNKPLVITGINMPTNIRSLSAKIGRGPQVQAGLEAARGDIIWILHSDSVIPTGAVKSLRHIITQSHISMGSFHLAFDKPGFWFGFFGWMSQFDSALTTFGDQGFFFPRHLLNRLPNLNHYPLMEDVVMRSVLLEVGSVKKSRLAITTSARRFDRYGPLWTQVKNAVILFRFWRGRSPQKLYEDYYASPVRVPDRVKDTVMLSVITPATK